MDKFCIFCGNKPQSKTREHIIPQWLISLTGDPNRDVFLGLKWSSPQLEKRIFSLNAFAFPACKDCNNEFSRLEDQAKTVVEGILSHAPLREDEWDIFLDWLDKVRTGIWLAMIYLNDNYRALLPVFHITRRVGAKDRLVVVYEIIEDGKKGVSWAGTESPLFHYMPSCFAMTINNFSFLNVSSDFLFSYRFGFPYPSKRLFREEGGQWIEEMKEGTGVLRFPLLNMKFKTGGTQLFQPIIPYGHMFNEDGSPWNIRKLYDNEYVRINCLDFKAGKGHIYKRERNTLIGYASKPSKAWIPKPRFPRGEIIYQTGVLTGNLLEILYRDHPSFDSLSEGARKEREAEVEGALRLHRVIMDHLLGQKDMFY